jgi:hypothetical protein
LSYSGLESHNLLVRHGVSLSDDWDQVDLGMQSTHDFNVQRFQGVASWLNEVHAGMNSVVDNVHSVDLVLGIQIRIEALLNVIHNWAP